MHKKDTEKSFLENTPLGNYKVICMPYWESRRYILVNTKEATRGNFSNIYSLNNITITMLLSQTEYNNLVLTF